MTSHIASSPNVPDANQANDGRRKRRALLAGGLVLGLGAAVTLAAFTDNEFAFGTFNTGKFNIEGSADGGTYADHPVDDEAAVLTFALVSTNMSPGQTVYAPYWIRTDAATTLDANITLNSVESDGPLTGYLTYQMASNSTTCDASTTFDWATTATAVDAVGTPNTPVVLDHQEAAAGTPIQVCIAVTLDSDEEAIRGVVGTADTTVTWGWLAESIDA